MTMVDYFGTYREKEDNQFLLFVIIVIFLILYEKLIYIYIYILIKRVVASKTKKKRKRKKDTWPPLYSLKFEVQETLKPLWL